MMLTSHLSSSFHWITMLIFFPGGSAEPIKSGHTANSQTTTTQATTTHTTTTQTSTYTPLGGSSILALAEHMLATVEALEHQIRRQKKERKPPKSFIQQILDNSAEIASNLLPIKELLSVYRPPSSLPNSYTLLKQLFLSSVQSKGLADILFRNFMIF